jgi:hypothetical protein
MTAKASEVIRATALQLIVKHPNGLSLAELRNLTEDKLKNLIEPDGNDSGKYRSSLWDLEKRFPEYINKINNGRLARFAPTPHLLANVADIVVPEFSPTAKELLNKGECQYKNKNYLDLVQFKAKVSEVIDLIEQIDIEGVNPRHSENPDEIKVIVKAIIHLEGLKDLKYSIQHVDNKNLDR